MIKLLERLLDKLFPHLQLPRGELVCNVSDDTNEWNRQALEYSWKDRQKPRAIPENGVYCCNVSKETNRWNRLALGYD